MRLRAPGAGSPRAILALLAAAGVAGCAAPATPALLRLDLPGTATGAGSYFPPPPELPRFLYAGELTGEANFHRQDDGARGSLRRLLDFITGIDSANAPRQVLQRPVAGVSDELGRIFVTDMSRQAVYVFDVPAGELKVWDRAIGRTGFAAPSGIALGARGEVLVADAELGVVVRLGPQGEPRGVLGKGVLRRPTGLARDAAGGRIFVADTAAHDIKVFDDAGGLLRVIGRRGEKEGEFNYPSHIAYARGALYVSDSMNSRVQVFSGDGELPLRSFGTRGLYVGNLVRPKGVAVDGAGNVYVVEGYYDHLLVFNPAGEFLLPIGGAGRDAGRFYLPSGVWVDARERVFVADMFNGRIAVFQFLGGR